MAIDVLVNNNPQQNSSHLHLIGEDEDIIEQELRMRKPRHKRLEYVAGWDIRQLVKDARRCRPTLHTRSDFHLKSSAWDISSLFEFGSTRSSRTGTASTKSSNRCSSIATKSSQRSSVLTKSSQRSSNNNGRSSVTTKASTAATAATNTTSFRFYDLMHFHHVHGSNVDLSFDRHTATRKANNFCNGIVFGHRPVKPGEIIHLRFNKVRPDWRGCIRLGFTPHNPGRCDPLSLPSYAVPDLRRKSRYWALPLKEKYATKYNIFSFEFKEDGSVTYRINNENKGTFLSGLTTCKSLWPMFDLYGKVEELAIVDEEQAKHGADALHQNDDVDDDEGDEVMRARRRSVAKEDSVAFHKVCGHNVKMDSQRCTAKRYDSFWNALTFDSRPLRTYDITFLEISKVEANYAGSLGVGLTNIDPGTLDPENLPDNADLLNTKPGQYWKISRDVDTVQGDQVGFVLDPTGVLSLSKNGSPAQKLISDIPVESGRFWLVFDIYGSTTVIKLMGRIRSFDPAEPSTSQKFAFEPDDLIQSGEHERECLMCFKAERIRDCTIQPCGHLSLCNWCAITCMVKQQLRFIVCPVCGGPVRDVIRILRSQTEEDEVEESQEDYDSQ